MLGRRKKANLWPLPQAKKKVLHSFDPLGDMEYGERADFSERFHEKAEKPTKLPKKTRSSPKESYYPMHGGRK